MGAWNTTFWDNDNCLGLLRLFFVHLGFMDHSSRYAIVHKTFPGMGTLIQRTSDDHELRMQMLMYTLKKETVEAAMANAPSNNFVETFKNDIMTLEKHYLDSIGISVDTFWTLLCMHFGMVVSVQDLDEAAKEFQIRRIPAREMSERSKPGNGWNIGEYLETFVRPQAPWVTPSGIERQRNKDAQIIHQGILKYKAIMQESPQDLQPMKLPFLGVSGSTHMWISRRLPLEGDFWNLDLDDTTNMTHDLDGSVVNVPHCASCHKALCGDASHPLYTCPCMFVKYCNIDCQKKHWRSHRFRHEVSTLGLQAARKKDEARVDKYKSRLMSGN